LARLRYLTELIYQLLIVSENTTIFYKLPNNDQSEQPKYLQYLKQ